MKKILALTAVVVLSFVMAASAQASIFTIWADSNGDGYKDLYLGSIQGYSGSITAKANYKFSSDSGHPINGPAPEANKLKIFIYENTSNSYSYLNIIMHKDGSNPNAWLYVDGIFDITGSSVNPAVVLSDDSGELTEPSANSFSGDWAFKKNTDGGVIGPLAGPWEARLDPGNSDMTSHGFYSADGSAIFMDNYDYAYFFISTAPVPEPASLMLLGTGVIGLIGLRKKKTSV